MTYCELNEDDLKRFMFEKRERFPNLRTLDISGNQIDSFCGIDDKINENPMRSSLSSCCSQSLTRRDNNLRLLGLGGNPVFKYRMINNLVHHTMKPKDSAALLGLLHTFNGISNLGLELFSSYEPDVEHVLRINYAGRKHITMGGGDVEISIGSTVTPNMNQALWPFYYWRGRIRSRMQSLWK